MTTHTTIFQRPAIWAAALLLAVLQGCATGPNANPADPLEPFNRTVFNFNDGLDRAVLKPVATGYRNITPQPVRTGVTNFFGNLSDVWSMVNNILQGKPREATDSLFRVTVNTVFGLGGILDFASQMNIEKHKEDFGQTLGVYGVGPGAYIVLPLLGPSTVRDTAGSIVDGYGDIVIRAHNVPVRNTGVVLRAVNGRANLLEAGDVLDQAALDKYSFTRDIYLQRRASLINDNPDAKEERFDLPEGAPATSGGAPAAAPAK
jgi:phospholipid-binding lipoprotein MlaA